MSVEMHVFFRGELPDKKALSRMMAELGFPLTIAAGSLERQSGFMPMRLRREQTGVEFDVYNERTAVEELGGNGLDPSLERSANFRWGGDGGEMLAGMCAAAALAKLVNGLVLDDGDGRLLSPDEAIAMARETLQSTLKPDGPQRRTYRTDIKHYLKPLLKQRSDLVLIGRMLVIQPVRHVLRGVFFEKITERSPFWVSRFLSPLFDADFEHSIRIDLLRVWEPHFEPLLMELLATEFEQLGKIANLDDFDAQLPDDGSMPITWNKPIIRTWAMLLSGQRERAAAYLDDFERRHPDNAAWKPWYAKLREFIARDVEDLCAHFRAKEAEGVKRWKLERVWESSPFPIELPAAERRNRSDEPAFVAAPWIARPASFMGELPERPGEVCFAKDCRLREGNEVLVVPLTREEAGERHRNREGYVLAARLVGGLLVLLKWDGTDRNHPDRLERPDHPPYVSWFILQIFNPRFVAHVVVLISNDFEEMQILKSVEVKKRSSGLSVWGWTLYLDEGEQEGREVVYEYQKVAYKRSVTSAEIEKLMFKPPGFSEFEVLVQLVLNVLRSKGYGEFM